MSNINQKSAVGVVIGRFQPFHNGHAALLTHALETVPGTVFVVLGSSFGARTPKNPFTWEERAAMISSVMGDRAKRLHFVPVRDYYDDERWRQDVLGEINKNAKGSPVFLVGHQKDASSAYLNWFTGWQLEEMPSLGQIDATPLRKAYFSAENPEGMLALLSTRVPAPVCGFLRGFACMPEYASLCEEARRVEDGLKSWEGAPYPPKFVTCDALVEACGYVLLIRRKGDLGHGLWALPGGHLDPHERLLECAMRELVEETHFGLHPETLKGSLKEVRVFDHPGRSLRGRTVTHVHHFSLGELARLPEVQGNGQEGEPRWVEKSALGAMEHAFFEDHFHILDDFFGLTTKS